MQQYVLGHRSGNLLFRRNNVQTYTVGYRSKQIAANILRTLEFPPKYMLLPDNPVELYEPQTKTRLVIDANATFFVPKRTSKDDLEEGLTCTIQCIEYEDFLLYPVTHGTGIVMPFSLITEDEHEYVYRSHVIDPVQ